MSSRLTRVTGIAAGTLVSGALFLGGAAPAFADIDQSNTSNNTASVDTLGGGNRSITVSKKNTAFNKVKQTNKINLHYNIHY